MAEERFPCDISRLLLSALGQTGEGISIVDLSGTVLYVNSSFARSHGYTEESCREHTFRCSTPRNRCPWWTPF
jgi:PAS domain S-box-containing protein